LEAKVFLAILTCNLGYISLFHLNYHIDAFRIGAELLKVTFHNFFLFLEQFELCECFSITMLLQKCLSDLVAASLLRALHLKTLVSRLHDLISEIVT